MQLIHMVRRCSLQEIANTVHLWNWIIKLEHEAAGHAPAKGGVVTCPRLALQGVIIDHGSPDKTG
jgi:hypothetical protein